jgi:hypothetical protein
MERYYVYQWITVYTKALTTMYAQHVRDCAFTESTKYTTSFTKRV